MIRAGLTLPSERWREVFAAADHALDLTEEERQAFVDRCAAADSTLGAALRTLLARARESSALDGAAASFAGGLVAELSADPDRAMTALRIGPYQVVRELGRGGMGAVYLAERADDVYRKRVALKLLPAWSAVDVHRVRRFQEERQILAALEHPDIARLLDGGLTADGLPWFAMEYVDGLPIDQYCDEQHLTIERRLELFRRVCAAVAFAHRNLVVHRDLKPANILVEEDGVKLLDFGIAKLLTGDPTAPLTQTGERVMTPLYASPEQLRGGPVSTASDVYALGALLHQLLTGRDPYRLASHETLDIAHAILEREPECPSASVSRPAADYDIDSIARARATTPARLRRRLEGDLDTIVSRALQKDPGQRYQGVEPLEADVQRHLTGLPIAARADSRVYRARKFVRRHKAGVAVGVVFGLVVVTFAVITAIQAARIRVEANRAAIERAAAQSLVQYVSNTFRNTVPSPQAGRGVTSREVLDAAAAGADSALPGQPAARAQLMFETGLAYHRLGVDDRAQHLLEASLALRRTLHPTGQPALAATLHVLGEVLLDRGDTERAERAFEEALELRRQQLGATHRDVARTLNGLAAVRRRQGRSWDAEVLAREALAIDRRRPGENRADVAQSLRSLGQALADQGEQVEAQRLYREALSALRQLVPDAHPDVARTVFELAASLKQSGDNAQADSLFRYGRGLYDGLLATTALESSPREPSLPRSLVPAKAPTRVEVAADSRIVFVSDRDGPDAIGHLGRTEIYIMNPDGSGQRRLTDYEFRINSPALSPDGRKIAFGGEIEGGVDIFVMNVDGTDRVRLTNMTGVHLGALRPAWSPDGSKVAFQSYTQPEDIYVINVDGTGLRNLTSHPGRDANPTWSPDGRRIAFATDRESQPAVYVMNADGSNPVRVIATEGPAPAEVRWLTPDWSPDGRRIAFVSEQHGNREIYAATVDGSEVVRLTDNPTEDAQPSWSPDGRQIVFHRRVTGHLQLFIMNADGTAQRRLTEPSPVAFNGFPSWGPAARASSQR